MNLKRLNLRPCNRYEAEDLAKAARIPLLLAMTLLSRGVSTPREVADYLNTGSELLLDPFMMRNMAKAVAIIHDAIYKGEKIAVYGDYDVDGVTATCVMVDTLKKLGASCAYYIPFRLSEGYGLHQEALRRLIDDEGASLIITVDTGITAVREVAYCKSRGVRVVVTDHHECPDILPKADAVIDPKSPVETYPFSQFAGVGVAFKLAQALLGDSQAVLERYAELVSLGTVADVMPLRDENRAIVNRGLQKLSESTNVGLRALCEETGLLGNRAVTASSLSFILAPRINAAGRFDAADRAARLFLTDDPKEAAEIAHELTAFNAKRQVSENVMLQEAEQVIRETCDVENDRVFILWHADWHHGILGIVASRLTERYARPVILLSVDGEVSKGSGRSIRGFNLYDALAALPTRPVQFGGHELAAGLTIETKNLEAFREDFRAYTREHLNPEDCVPTLDVDCEIEPEMLTLDAVASLSLLEPTGMGNPEPMFYMNDLVIREIAAIGNGKHTRMKAERHGVTLNCVYFGKSPTELRLGEGDVMEVAANAQINDFRGKSVQLILREARLAPHERERDRISRGVYEKFSSGDTIGIRERVSLCPSRQEMVAIWKCLAADADEEGYIELESAWFHREIRRRMRTPLTEGKLLTALDVFAELRLLRIEHDGEKVMVQLISGAPKANLNASLILQELSA